MTKRAHSWAIGGGNTRAAAPGDVAVAPDGSTRADGPAAALGGVEPLSPERERRRQRVVIAEGSLEHAHVAQRETARQQVVDAPQRPARAGRHAEATAALAPGVLEALAQARQRGAVRRRVQVTT